MRAISAFPVVSKAAFRAASSGASLAAF